jgi:hypothetical protein
MTHYYRKATFQDCRELAPAMREQDAKEVMASNAYTLKGITGKL